MKPAIIIVLHAGLLLLAAAVASTFLLYQAEFGAMTLAGRAGIASLAVLLALAGARPFIPWFSSRLPAYILVICLPALAVSPWYFLSHLPGRLTGGMMGEQIASSLITENTSNPIVEVGFAYPIYTPTISLTNNELYTKNVNVFLRIIDGNNDPALFRAVRADLPDSRLSVEASVHGLLSEATGYYFIPVEIPPGKTLSGQVVFIISDLNDGSTFDEALGRSYPAEFQVRDPDSGDLLLSFPMTRI